MAIKIGDKVRFLNSVGGGRVVRMLDKRTAMVETDDGFQIPTLCAELVAITTDDYNFEVVERSTEPAAPPAPRRRHADPHEMEEEPEPEPIAAPRDAPGDDIALLLAFVPNDINRLSTTTFDCYLINDSTYRVLYSIGVWQNGRLSPLASGMLPPDTKEAIQRLAAASFAHRPVLNLQAIYLKNTDYTPHRPEHFDYEVNPLRMLKSGAFTDNDYFDERALVVAIADSQRELLMQRSTAQAIEASIKQKDQPQRSAPKPKPVEQEEVDLHIHELVDSYQHLSPGEIIRIQLSRFEVALETAIKSKSTRRVVFIHGVGAGKLKYEISKILDNQYPKLRYQDASFKEYGYGATLVYIK